MYIAVLAPDMHIDQMSQRVATDGVDSAISFQDLIQRNRFVAGPLPEGVYELTLRYEAILQCQQAVQQVSICILF